MNNEKENDLFKADPAIQDKPFDIENVDLSLDATAALRFGFPVDENQDEFAARLAVLGARIPPRLETVIQDVRQLQNTRADGQ